MSDKPWISAFSVSVPVKLQSKSNFRRGKGYQKKWADLKSFDTVVAATVRGAIPDEWPLGDPDDSPDNRPVVMMIVSAKSRYDAANFSKSIADAVEGIVYLNDRSLRYPVAESRTDKNVLCDLAFAVFDPETPISVCRNSIGLLFEEMDND